MSDLLFTTSFVLIARRRKFIMQQIIVVGKSPDTKEVLAMRCYQPTSNNLKQTK